MFELLAWIRTRRDMIVTSLISIEETASTSEGQVSADAEWTTRELNEVLRTLEETERSEMELWRTCRQAARTGREDFSLGRMGDVVPASDGQGRHPERRELPEVGESRPKWSRSRPREHASAGVASWSV